VLDPDEGRYGYTYAFYLCRHGEIEQAMIVLSDMIDRSVPYGDAYALLATIHLQRANRDKAVSVYLSASNNTRLTQQERENFKAIARQLEQGP
jgi:hypothetical protein